MPTNYREDIDRLRGLAVLSVIAFHLDVPGIRGGYVGVDIFFVISGFLITQIIQKEMHSGDFSFVAFYERRVRRLLPALYVVTAVSIIPALILLLASEQRGFLKSVAAVVTFTSNFLFWSESRYFDRIAVQKPLLHTWSLSVEEQFYLAFPAFIWLLLRYTARFRYSIISLHVVLLTTLAASFMLGLSLLKSGYGPAAFYLSPPRAWEFLCGSILAIRGFPTPAHNWQRHLGIGTAYALLLVPIFGLRPGSIFPGWNALAPCLGAAIFIWSGSGDIISPPRHRFSPYRLARLVGVISYSLYLWHWPIITFTRFAQNGIPPNGLEKRSSLL